MYCFVIWSVKYDSWKGLFSPTEKNIFISSFRVDRHGIHVADIKKDQRRERWSQNVDKHLLWICSFKLSSFIALSLYRFFVLRFVLFCNAFKNCFKCSLLILERRILSSMRYIRYNVWWYFRLRGRAQKRVLSWTSCVLSERTGDGLLDVLDSVGKIISISKWMFDNFFWSQLISQIDKFKDV